MCLSLSNYHCLHLEIYIRDPSFTTMWFFFRIIGVGPRLTTLLVDISDHGELSLADATRFLPVVPYHHTLVLCAYVFHDLSPELLSQMPMHTALAEYGFLVRRMLACLILFFDRISECVFGEFLTRAIVPNRDCDDEG